MQKTTFRLYYIYNTYINILHITATQRGSRRVTQRMAGWLQFSPHRRLAEQLLVLIIPGMGFGFYFLLSLFFCFLFFVCFFSSSSPFILSPPSPVSDLVCPVWRSAIGGFGSLRLLLHGAGLVALARSTLPVLLKVVMQHLGMRLLMCREDMEERGWSITRGSTRVQGPSRSESRRQAEGRWSASMESLLVKRLSLVID